MFRTQSRIPVFHLHILSSFATMSGRGKIRASCLYLRRYENLFVILAPYGIWPATLAILIKDVFCPPTSTVIAMNVLYANIVVGTLITAYVLYRLCTRRPFAHIPGPKAESFLLGSLRQLLQPQAGETDCKWEEQYGGLVPIKSVLGSTQLLVSDPKALQYIYQTAAYSFRKSNERLAVISLFSGRGLLWAQGDLHKRQRKVMTPAFGAPECKALLPIFRQTASQVASKWRGIVGNGANQSHVINVPEWLARGTLDAIGKAAFDYNFGAIDKADNELANVYANIFSNAFGAPSAGAIFTLFGLRYLPVAVCNWVFHSSPSSRLQPARNARDVSTRVAKELVSEKTNAALEGTFKKDVMSILVRSNLGENPRGKLTDAEMYDQLRTIIIAGHETTANALTWSLFEVAKNSGLQTKLRDEIWATESAARERGELGLTIQDFDKMPYTTAFMKEVLRLHPAVSLMYREAAEDVIIPLSKPLVTTQGKVLHEVHVPKGTGLMMSIAAYNKNKDLWGEDAYKMRPERWLDGSLEKDVKQSSVGVYGNLMSFSAGPRSCIGWRFAVIEIQAFLVELIGNFEFSMGVDPRLIRQEHCNVVVPTIQGEVEKGVQLPLRVKPISRAE